MREEKGEYHQLISDFRRFDPDKFFKYFRMDIETFDQLLELLRPALQKQTTNCRQPISPSERLAVTLRYLATGDSQRTISVSYRLGKATVTNIVSKTCAAIWDILSPVYLKPPTTDDYKRIAADFDAAWQLPHCIGAVDGKHVVIQAPKLAGSAFFNYKHSHSVHLMASCDAQYVLIHVDIEAEGHQSDSGVFQSSSFGEAFAANTVDLPDPVPLPGTDRSMPYFLIGDEGFPLKTYLMRPFPGRDLTVQRRVFNYRLCRARRCIENTFGIIAARWRIFRRPIIANLSTIDGIIKATCCLYNFLMMSRMSCSRYCPKSFADVGDRNGTVTPGEWRKVAADDSSGGLRPSGAGCTTSI